MEHHPESGKQQPWTIGETADIKETQMPIGGASPAELHEPAQPETHQQAPLAVKAKELGRSALDMSSKLYHRAEEKIHELKEQDMDPEQTKKAKIVAGASAGTVALASTARVIARRRNSRQRSMTMPKMTAPQQILIKAKEAMPFNH